jgi:hypothetical protein
MRIDEINLLGQFKITGNTGSNSQAIGMSGGSTSFIDVVASGGSSEGLVKRSGYNYVIVEATGDALANGIKLKDAYIDVATLFNIGTPGIDNRFSILLTPGDYNFGDNQLSIDTSYIDVVGISQNPLDTIIRASGTFSTIIFDGNHDFGIYNIDLRSGGTGQQVAFSDGGSGSTYLRMKNVVISGNGFFDSGTSFYSFYDLDGEFEDITVLDGCNFAIASNSISGTYKNIKIGDVSYAFYAGGNLTGTYKNITISNLTGNGFSGTIISGIFEDINIKTNNGNTFVGGNSLSGYFKNITIFSGSPALVFYGGITGIFEDIEISSATNAFVSTSYDIDGTFKNIKIGDFTSSAFYGNNVYGTYSNIEIDNAPSGSAFQSTSDLSASFKDITLGNVGIAFQSGINITGTYENITIGNVDGDCFTSTISDITGIFKNIKVGDVGTSFFTSVTDLSGTFEDITVGDATYAFYAPNSILGTFKNISVKSTVESFFYTDSSDINGTFDQIYIGNCGNSTFKSPTILTGTFSNIEIVNSGRIFVSADVNGYYDGITIGAASNETFNNITTGTYKNIKIGSCPSFFTSTSNIQPTLVENIEVGESGTFIDSGDALGGTYKNIKVGSITGNAFSADLGITGTYSNIEVGSCTGDMFYGGSNTSPITVNVDNLFVGTVSTIFDPGPGGVSAIVSGKFNKLDVTGNCFGYALRSKQFVAKLTNSRINMIGRNDAMFLNGGQIERCKILTDASTMSGSGQVIYTMTNQSNVVSGATQCISDTSITS